MEDRFKFRAWDIEKKGMSYFHNKRGMQYNNDEIRISNGWDGNDNPKYWGGDDEEYVDRTDKYILMQSTGLKDKNGKLIYEGDILQLSGNDNPYMNNVIGIVRYTQKEAIFYIDIFKSSAWYEFNEVEKKGLSIIGNIYENKELLEEQK